MPGVRIPSLRPHLRWAIRAPQVFLFLTFVPAFLSGYLFINTSQACGEQFTRRRFFLFLAFVPAFQGGYLFFNASQRLTAADRPRTHSCRCALFLFLRWKHRFLRFFSAEAPTRKPRSGVFLLLNFTLPLKTAILYAVQAQQRLLSGRTYYRFVSFGRIPISKQLFSY